MKFQLLLATTLIILPVATPSVEAGPTFTFAAYQVPSGPGSVYGNTNYVGPNNFSGSVYAAPNPGGILGNGTPLHSGSVLIEASTTFGVNGNSGSFDISNGISNDFTGTVVTSAVASNGSMIGGTFTVDGYLSTAAANYFGVSATTLMFGTASITITPAAAPGGPLGNYDSTISFTFSPATTVPEPSSLVLLGIGVLGLAAAVRRRRGRA